MNDKDYRKENEMAAKRGTEVPRTVAECNNAGEAHDLTDVFEVEGGDHE